MTRLAAVAVLAVLGGPAAARPDDVEVPALTGESFVRWLEFLRPAPGEQAWTAIPWRATFWDAVVESQAADKPILLWAMNGHPLACT